MKCPLAIAPHINTLTKKQLRQYSFNCAFDVSAPDGLLKGPTPDFIKIVLKPPIKRGEELLTSYSFADSASTHVQDYSAIAPEEYQAALLQQPEPIPLETLGRRKGSSKRRRRGKHHSRQSSALAQEMYSHSLVPHHPNPTLHHLRTSEQATLQTFAPQDSHMEIVRILSRRNPLSSQREQYQMESVPPSPQSPNPPRPSHMGKEYSSDEIGDAVRPG